MVGSFTLAALATSAAPGFATRGVRPIGDAAHTAQLTDADGGAAVVRVGAGARHAARLRADAAATAAFTTGVRARLPFAVHSVIGIAEPGPVLVTTWLPGTALRPAAVRPDSPLAAALGRAIAAVHALPTSIADGGLVQRPPAAAQRAARELLDALGDRLPDAVERRWREAVDHAAMWRYRPVVAHGSLAPDELLVEHDAVTGVLGWSMLQIGDPAADLAWALSLPVRGAADAVFRAYSAIAAPDPLLRQRATLLAELELAKWLRHALDERDDALVDDATALLTALDARVRTPGAAPLVGEPTAVLSLHEALRLLDGHEDRLLAASASAQRASSSASDSMASGRTMRSADT